MTDSFTAQASTALSPEWDRGFDEAFTDLVSSDADLVRAEFEALIGASWNEPPAPPVPPAPSTAEPAASHPGAGTGDDDAARGAGREPGAAVINQRSPP